MKKLFTLLTIIFFTTTIQAQWTQLGTDFYGRTDFDHNGHSLDFSADGKTIAISAPEYDFGRKGYVHVYEWNGSSWVQKGNDIIGGSVDEYFGVRLALSNDGNTFVVGAPENDNAGTNAGTVRVYEWDGNAWVQKGGDIDGEAPVDWFGVSVSMNASGNIIAAGASFNDGADTNAGHGRVFEWHGGSWIQKGVDIDGLSHSDRFAIVSLNAVGDIVAIGSQYNDGAGADAGHVRIFAWNGAAWVQKGSTISGSLPGSYAGSPSLNAVGDIVAIGGLDPARGANTGSVRVFEWDGSDWKQKGADIDDEAVGDGGGHARIDGSGNRIVVGAEANSDGGADAGHVRVFDWDGGSWVQLGTDIDGIAYDELGMFVAISDDGATIATGNPFNDAGGIIRGLVRVYRYTSPVGIVESSFNEHFTAYPNPTTGNFAFDLGHNYETANIKIMDVTGREVLSKSYNTVNQLNITLNEPKGIYFYVLELNDEKNTIYKGMVSVLK